MKKLAFVFAMLMGISLRLSAEELLSVNGTAAKEGDLIEVPLRDLHPTQPIVAFDEIYYKLGRFEEDRRKIFREYCKHNGQQELVSLTDASDLRDASSFICQQAPGSSRDDMKSAVIAPNGQLYLINGHHTFIEFWQLPQGGPNLRMNVILVRDYRWLPSMQEFWDKMVVDQNVWLFDPSGNPVKVENLPETFDLKNFRDDPYRSLMYFTRRIAWNSPERWVVPDTDEYYPAIPFVEFFWAREIRKTLNLTDFDLNTREGYVAAIRAVGMAIINVHSKNVGGSGKTLEEVGQFRFFNERELARIDRPDTGKLAYLLAYKNAHSPAAIANRNRSQVRDTNYTAVLSD